MTRTLRNLILLLCLVALASFAFAQAPTERPFLSPMFSDHMVLQRDTAIPVWGWTTPGADITVYFNGTTTKATARADGYWLAKLPRQKAGGPFTMTVRGPQTVTLIDVLVGDVWLCSVSRTWNRHRDNHQRRRRNRRRQRQPDSPLYSSAPRRSRAGPVDPKPVVRLFTGNTSSAGAVRVEQFFRCSLLLRPRVAARSGCPDRPATDDLGRHAGGSVDEPGTPAPLHRIQGAPGRPGSRGRSNRTGNLLLQKDVDEWWTRNDPGLKAATPWSSATLNTQGWTTARVPATSRTPECPL